MRILLDTNVIISAFTFQSVQMMDMVEFAMAHHGVVMTQQIASEARSVTVRKHPARLDVIEAFLADSRLEFVSTVTTAGSSPIIIRDETDQGVLDEAIASDVDVIITGDKDFHAVDIKKPRIMYPAEFIAEFISGTD